MAVGYSRFSSSTFPSVYAAGREAGDPAGQLKDETLVHAGEAYYTAYDSSPRRWGDYTGMAIDPDGLRFWYVGEYSRNQATARWSTWVASFTFPGCTGGGGPTPTPGPTNTPTATPPPSGNTGFRSPTANAAVTGGDNNGFQTNPTNAYSDNGAYAVDTNSGNGNQTSCTSARKDKHNFYNYGFTIPGGSAIAGIEVQLQARADATTGSPRMCVQLSWDGGVTWTTAKTTANLTTSEATYTLGSAADTWGRAWSTADFSDANFRLRIINVASNTSRDFSLDWVAVRVTYQ
jgi:hypothetical protein